MDLTDLLENIQVPPSCNPLETLERYMQTYLSRGWDQPKMNRFLENLGRSLIPSKSLGIYVKGHSVEDIIEEVERDVVALCADSRSLQLIEDILVPLLGHPKPYIRSRVVRLLNVLYDGHAWQLEEPFSPVIRTVGDTYLMDYISHWRLTNRFMH